MQQPAKELETLRGQPVSIKDVRLDSTAAAFDGIQGNHLEIVAEFLLGDATHVGLHLLMGSNGEQTTVGYDVGSSSIFIDRHPSGE